MEHLNKFYEENFRNVETEYGEAVTEESDGRKRLKHMERLQFTLDKEGLALVVDFQTRNISKNIVQRFQSISKAFNFILLEIFNQTNTGSKIWNFQYEPERQRYDMSQKTNGWPRKQYHDVD